MSPAVRRRNLDGNIGYVIPLTTEDREAFLSLPPDLTPGEAARLSATIAALAIPDDDLAAPSSPGVLAGPGADGRRPESGR